MTGDRHVPGSPLERLRRLSRGEDPKYGYTVDRDVRMVVGCAAWSPG